MRIHTLSSGRPRAALISTPPSPSDKRKTAETRGSREALDHRGLRSSQPSPTTSSMRLIPGCSPLVIHIESPISVRSVLLAAQAEATSRWRSQSTLPRIPREPADHGARSRKESWPAPATRALPRPAQRMNRSPQPQHFAERSLPRLLSVALRVPCECQFRLSVEQSCRPMFRRVRFQSQAARMRQSTEQATPSSVPHRSSCSAPHPSLL